MNELFWEDLLWYVTGWFWEFSLLFIGVYATLSISLVYNYKEWTIWEKVLKTLLCLAGCGSLGLLAWYCMISDMISGSLPGVICVNAILLLMYSWCLYDLAFKRSHWSKLQRYVFMSIWVAVMFFVFALIMVGDIIGYFE